MAKATTVTYTIRDAKGRSSIAKINIPSATLFTNLVGFAQAAAALYEPLMLGVISKASISVPITYAPTSPNVLSDVQKRGLMTFHDASGLVARTTYPTWLESKTVDNSDQIDIVDADVAALIALVVTGDGTIAPVTSHATNITGIDVAREIFRRTVRR